MLLSRRVGRREGADHRGQGTRQVTRGPRWSSARGIVVWSSDRLHTRVGGGILELRENPDGGLRGILAREYLLVSNFSRGLTREARHSRESISNSRLTARATSRGDCHVAKGVTSECIFAQGDQKEISL